MAKKHLAAVSLLIVLIFGLTSCVCRSSDMLHCVSFELVPNGAGTNVWAKEFCGPLTDLASYFLSPEQDEEWPLENTMPSSEQLFREYIETYKKYT